MTSLLQRPLLGLPVAIFDFETTGVDTARCWPVQVAVAHLELGRTVPRVVLRTLVRPPVPIPPEASEVHGITDADVADAPPWEAVQGRVLDALAGRVACAYNLPYDLPILRRLSGAPIHPAHGLDPLVWARVVDKYERGKRLGDVCGRRNIPLDAHDAGGDVLATGRVMPRLLNELLKGRQRLDAYGRPRSDGPWIRPGHVRRLADFLQWQHQAALAWERDFAAYLARNGRTGFDYPWHRLLGVPPR